MGPHSSVVEHCSVNAEATGSSPFEALLKYFFRLNSQLHKLRFTTAMVTSSFLTCIIFIEKVKTVNECNLRRNIVARNVKKTEYATQMKKYIYLEPCKLLYLLLLIWLVMFFFSKNKFQFQLSQEADAFFVNQN